MYGREEGGASAGRAKAGLVRCREAYATVVLVNDGRAQADSQAQTGRR
jgi:hypothetical protein